MNNKILITDNIVDTTKLGKDVILKVLSNEDDIIKLISLDILNNFLSTSKAVTELCGKFSNNNSVYTPVPEPTSNILIPSLSPSHFNVLNSFFQPNLAWVSSLFTSLLNPTIS